MKRILIATPTIDGKIYVDFLNTFIGFLTKTPNCHITFMSISGSSLIQQARNYFFTYFILNKEYDYLLFWDSDISVPDYTLFQLLCRNKDIIGLPIPLKIPSSDKFLMSVGEVIDREGDLLEVTGIPTAFMLISRRVANAVEQNFNDRIYENSNKESSLRELYDVFRVGLIGKTFYGEDYFFCREMRELGFKIYADPTIPVKHWGTYPYNGDFRFLLNKEEKGLD